MCGLNDARRFQWFADAVPFDRNLVHFGPVLKDLYCHLHCLSWIKRRDVRKRLLQKKNYVGIRRQWDLETDIGRQIAVETRRKADLAFYVTMSVNRIKGEVGVGVYLIAETVTSQHACGSCHVVWNRCRKAVFLQGFL